MVAMEKQLYVSSLPQVTALTAFQGLFIPLLSHLAAALSGLCGADSVT